MVVLLCQYFHPTPALQILVYTLSAQVVRLTTLPIEFSMKLPTKWYMRVWIGGGGGSGIHFSLKIQPIISLIKILGNSLK